MQGLKKDDAVYTHDRHGRVTGSALVVEITGDKARLRKPGEIETFKLLLSRLEYHPQNSN